MDRFLVPLPRGSLVELVISRYDGFLVTKQLLREFFTRWDPSALQSRLTIFFTQRLHFDRLEISQLFAYWDNPNSDTQSIIATFTAEIAQREQRRIDISEAQRSYRPVSGQFRNALSPSRFAPAANPPVANPLANLRIADYQFSLLRCTDCRRVFSTMEDFNRDCEPVHNTRDVSPVQKDIGTHEARDRSPIIKLYVCQHDNATHRSYFTFEMHCIRHNPPVRPSSAARMQLIDRDNLEDSMWECQKCALGQPFSGNLVQRGWAHIHPESPWVRFPNFKFTSPANSCGWTFKRFWSYVEHNHRFHGDEELPFPGYKKYPPDTPNDPCLWSIHPQGIVESAAVVNQTPTDVEAGLDVDMNPDTAP